MLGTVFLQTTNFIDAMYIVAFSLLIYGMSGLTGPRTAVRGNKIAAVGHGDRGDRDAAAQGRVSRVGTVWLILLGVVIGTAIGVPAARNVKMTAMPQMVALFNGVGGGAVALIAWVEYRHHFGGDFPLKVEIFELFGAIVGSISFWGSNIAFGSCRRSCPGRPIKLPGPERAQSGRCCCRVASAVVPAAGTHSQALFILGILVAAAVLGNMVVLPIGGADMPVVISLLNAFTGLSAAATGVALQQRADRRRDDRRRLGHDPDQPDGEGDEPLGSGDRRRGLRRRGRRSGGGAGAPRAARSARPQPRTSRSSSPTPAWS
jgi:NAD(P) transhydrogenase subunit beta